MNPEPTASADKRRRQRLSVAAALTLLATAWAATQGDDVASVAQPAKPRGANVAPTPNNINASTTASDATKPITAWPDAPLTANRAPWPAVSALGTAAWRGPDVPKVQAPVPAQPVVAKANPAPATPEAPNFPYVLIGRIDDGTPQAMLSGPSRSFGARVNEVIDGQWRVDAVGPQSMSLTWLPGSIKKTVTFASS
jgi:type IV secretory pathway VirB10-like protein